MKNLLFAALATLSLSATSANSSADKPKHLVLSAKNTVVLNDAFSFASVTPVTLKAQELCKKLPAGEHIKLVIYSPGGEIGSGIEFIRNMNALGCEVDTVTMFSASMGFQTVQGINGKRYILADGTLMSHRAKGGFEGEFPGQLDTRRTWYGKKLTRMNQRAVDRSNGKITLKDYEELIRDEYWCDGQDCVDKGFADEVVTASCDASMTGTITETKSNAFMGMQVSSEVETAVCPLITGSSFMNKGAIKLDGKPASEVISSIAVPSLRAYLTLEFEKFTTEMLDRYNRVSRKVIEYTYDETK